MPTAKRAKRTIRTITIEQDRAYAQAPITLACASAPGFNGGDLRTTGLTSLKGCRTSLGQNPAPVNVKTQVGQCTGYVRDADLPDNAALGTMSKSAKKHALKRMQRGTQRIPAGLR